MNLKILFLSSAIACSGLSAYAFDKKDKNSEGIIMVKDETSQTYVCDTVIDAPNITKDVLFSRVKSWTVANIKSADNNNVYDDKEYKIINTAAIKIEPKNGFGWTLTDGFFDFKLSIFFKDGRLKIHIDNVVFHAEFMSANPETYTYEQLKNDGLSKHLRSQSNSRLGAVIAAIAKAANSDTKSNDNW